LAGGTANEIDQVALGGQHFAQQRLLRIPQLLVVEQVILVVRRQGRGLGPAEDDGYSGSDRFPP
jgi:hypothetical protein